MCPMIGGFNGFSQLLLSLPKTKPLSTKMLTHDQAHSDDASVTRPVDGQNCSIRLYRLAPDVM
jgi:hypothetical protein